MKHSPKPLDLNGFLPYRLSVVTNKVSRLMAELYASRFSLSIAEWRVMAVLGQQPGLSAEQVCRRTEMDKVTVSRAVAKLRDKALIERQVDSDDRRRSVLRLSHAGHGVYVQIVPLARDFEYRLRSGLSASESDSLDRLLSKLDDHIRDLGQAYAEK